MISHGPSPRSDLLQPHLIPHDHVILYVIFPDCHMSNAALSSKHNQQLDFASLAMQRHTLQRLLTSLKPSSIIPQNARAFASIRGPADYSDEDLAAARKWLAG